MAYTKGRPPAAPSSTIKLKLNLDPDTYDRLHARAPQKTKASLERTAYRLLQAALARDLPPGQDPAPPPDDLPPGLDLAQLPAFRR